MVNHPNRSKTFKVTPLFGSSEKEGETHFAIHGRGVDNTFTQGAALAEFIERTLNAAYAAFSTNT